MEFINGKLDVACTNRNEYIIRDDVGITLGRLFLLDIDDSNKNCIVKIKIYCSTFCKYLHILFVAFCPNLSNYVNFCRKPHNPSTTISSICRLPHLNFKATVFARHKVPASETIPNKHKTNRIKFAEK